MPVVDLDYRRLQRLSGVRSRARIAQALPYLGLDIERETAGSVSVEYSPNRMDYSTDYGIAAGLRSLLGAGKSAPVPKVSRPAAGASIRADPAVSQLRPFITGIIAQGKVLDDADVRQLMAMQEDLHAGPGRGRKRSSIGIHDLDAVSFPLLYTAAARSHRLVPLGSSQEMSAAEVIAKTSVGAMYGPLLGRSAKVPVLLDSNGRTISLPPVINAASTALGAGTRGVFVEVTGTRKKDAEDVLAVVAHALSCAGLSLRGVAISGAGNTAPRLAARKMSLDASQVRQALGLDISPRQAAVLLRKCAIGASAGAKKVSCTVPPHRFDVLGPMDLVEEVALGYGIQNMAPTTSPPPRPGAASAESDAVRRLADAMIGLGYTEAFSSCLSSARVQYEAAGRSPKGAVRVLGSKSLGHTLLRDSLLGGLAEALSHNVHEPYPQRLFEIGPVFLRRSTVQEKTSLCAVSAHKDSSYTETKAALQASLGTFGIQCSTRAAEHPAFEPGRCADIVSGGKKIGVAGELGRQVRAAFKIREPAAAFEVGVSGLIFG